MCWYYEKIKLDVGHGAKEIKLHKLWSRRIIEEFFLQGDLE